MCKVSPKVTKTCYGCLVFLFTGISITILGPTLLDLQLGLGETLKRTAYAVPTKALFYAIGTVIAGLSSKLAPTHILTASTLTIGAIILSLTPWCKTLPLLLTTAGVSGFFIGACDVFIILYFFELWGKRGSTIIQIGYFFYGLGAFGAPLIVSPFLIPSAHENGTFLPHSLKDTLTSERVEYLPISLPYGAAGVLGTVGGMLVLILGKIPAKEDTSKSVDNSQVQTQVSRLKYFFMVGLGGLIIHVVYGILMSVGAMLETYLVEGEAQLDKKSAAFLTSAFWGGYASFRLVIFLTVETIGNAKSLAIEMLIVFASNGILLFLRENYTMLWIGIILLGIGCSSIFGLIVGYLQKYVTVSPNMLSFFLINCCIAEFLYPTVIATTIQISPNLFIYVVSSCSMIMCALTALLLLIGWYQNQQSKHKFELAKDQINDQTTV